MPVVDSLALCGTNPCQNEGVCSVDEGQVKCVCAAGNHN